MPLGKNYKSNPMVVKATSSFEGLDYGRGRCREGSEIEKKPRVINKISKPNLYTLERRNRGVTDGVPTEECQTMPHPPPGRDPYGLLPPGDPLRRGKKMGYITSPRRPQSTEKGTSLYVPYFLSGFSGLAVFQ